VLQHCSKNHHFFACFIHAEPSIIYTDGNINSNPAPSSMSCHHPISNLRKIPPPVRRRHRASSALGVGRLGILPLRHHTQSPHPDGSLLNLDQQRVWNHLPPRQRDQDGNHRNNQSHRHCSYHGVREYFTDCTKEEGHMFLQRKRR